MDSTTVTPPSKNSSSAPANLDIASNRSATKYTKSEMIRRVLWMFAQPLYRFSPRPCFGWRRLILRLFGGKIGSRVNVYPSSRIYFPWKLEIGNDSSIGEDAFIYNLGQVTIGSGATISHRAHLCAGTHDYTDPTLPLLKPPIIVGNNAWVCADSFIGPNVVIGEGAIVGARAAVFKDVEPWAVVGGNPAKFIKRRELNASTAKCQSEIGDRCETN